MRTHFPLRTGGGSNAAPSGKRDSCVPSNDISVVSSRFQLCECPRKSSREAGPEKKVKLPIYVPRDDSVWAKVSLPARPRSASSKIRTRTLISQLRGRVQIG